MHTGKRKLLQRLLSTGETSELSELYCDVHRTQDCGDSLENCLGTINNSLRPLGLECRGVVMRSVRGGGNNNSNVNGNESQIHHVVCNTKSDLVAKENSVGGTASQQTAKPIYLKRILTHFLTRKDQYLPLSDSNTGSNSQGKLQPPGVLAVASYTELLNLMRPVQVQAGEEEEKDDDDSNKNSSTKAKNNPVDPTFTLQEAEGMLQSFIREKWLLYDSEEKLVVGSRTYGELGSSLEALVSTLKEEQVSKNAAKIISFEAPQILLN